MEIKITNSSIKNDEQILVSFISEYGVCEGIWVGDPPVLNHTYNVEINIEEDLIWGVNVFNSKEQKFILEKNTEHIKIIAQVESIEDENLCVLKLGSSILMENISGSAELKKGTFIEIKSKIIRIFDSNL